MRRAGPFLAGTWPGRAALAALLALAVVAAVLLAAGPGPDAAPDAPPARSEAVPYDGRSPREPAGERQRVLLALQRPALGEVAGVADMDAGAQRAYVRSLQREARALRGALQARGVALDDVAGFERTWNGFAATVATEDLAAIGSLGVRAQPVRRFYPAVSEPAVSGGRPAPRGGPPSGQTPVALLAAGVAGTPGHDAVDADDDPSPEPDPRDPRRRESSGTALAGVLAAAGERVLPIRVSALQTGTAGGPPEEFATSDQLLAGLERAVDPDGDGDSSDHARVALVGVNAPYAGFAGSPEASAVAGAAGLGTLVVAPAGNEGPARPPSGTVGSPGAAAAALTAGASGGSQVLPRVELRAGEEVVARGVAVLAGAPPAAAFPLSAPVEATDAAALLRRGAPRLQGTLALVRAGTQPGAQAAAAAAAGARAVIVAEPRDGRPLPALPAGRAAVPVLGVTGEAARALLGREAGARISAGRPAPAPPAPRAARGPAPAPFSSRGPALDGLPKPDVLAPGAATTLDPAGRAAVAGGTAVAAARIAAAASRISRRVPGLGPAQLRAAVTAGAEPPPVVSAEPPALVPPRSATVLLRATARVTVALRAPRGATVRPSTVRLAPGRPRRARLRLRRGGPREGRLLGTDPDGRPVLSVPFAAQGPAPPAVAVGRVELARRGREVVGVRFALGAFDRGDPLGAGTSFQPVERLALELIRPGRGVVRRLTPSRGARELLPAEYAYTLPRAVRRDFGSGRLAFRVRAWAPRQRKPTERRSEPFRRP